MVRDVPNASLLPPDLEVGPAAEDSTRVSAARWGLPDFVFLPEQQRQGAGVRERGDGLVVADGIAALIQVKARNAEPGTPDREASWLTSAITKAIKQAKGSIRHLAHRRENLTSGRGRRVEIDGGLFQWIAVVIVDHPAPPAGFVPSLEEAGAIPCVVLLRRDWEFLFEHLRSTRSVLHYLQRVAGETAELGAEPSRYMQVALADLQAEAKEMPEKLRSLAGLEQDAPVVSTPYAPLEAADDGALLFRIIMEDVATTHMGESTEADRLKLLTSLDTVPAAYRPELGRVLLKFMSTISRHRGSSIKTETRVFVPHPGDQCPIVFIVASKLDSMMRNHLFLRTQLHHEDYWRSIGGVPGSTIGVLLTPSSSAKRQWDTSTVWLDGEQAFDAQQVAKIRQYINSGLQRSAR
ncbi:hypothetical protein NG696_14115 [Pseudarthrobacter sp. HLT1-5]|nr:hypothetical protein [Pseudarthrobacter sp. HLT1-5]